MVDFYFAHYMDNASIGKAINNPENDKPTWRMKK